MGSKSASLGAATSTCMESGGAGIFGAWEESDESARDAFDARERDDSKGDVSEVVERDCLETREGVTGTGSSGAGRLVESTGDGGGAKLSRMADMAERWAELNASWGG